MSFFANGFDANKVQPSTAFQPLPEGVYKVHVKSCVEEPTKDRTGLMLKAELAVLEPAAHKGRSVFHRITLKNKNATAVEIGQAQLSAFCRGTGVMLPKSAGQFVGKLLTVKIKVEKRHDNGELANRVDGVVLDQAAPAAPQAAPAAPAAPAAGQPPATTLADQSAPWG